MKKSDLLKLVQKPGGGVGSARDFVGPQKVTFSAENVRELAEGSPFAGQFMADRWKAYIEVDICTSLPAVAGPTSSTGNYLGYHPSVLARCHGSLLHQQTNQHHLIKRYNPKQILNDAIVGSVVGTWFPEEPVGGWKIPEALDEVVAIRACAVVFRQAEGATEMLDEMLNRRRKWSVSIEVVPSNFEGLGLFIPSQQRMVPLLEADEDLLKCLEDDGSGRLLVRKWEGEQIVLAMGALDGNVEFQGFAYTPHPASPDDHIVQVLASGGKPDEEMLRLVVERCYKGAKLESVTTEGMARLRGCLWGREATAENPCLTIQLASGRRILKRASEMAGKI